MTKSESFINERFAFNLPEGFYSDCETNNSFSRKRFSKIIFVKFRDSAKLPHYESKHSTNLSKRRFPSSTAD